MMKAKLRATMSPRRRAALLAGWAAISVALAYVYGVLAPDGHSWGGTEYARFVASLLVAAGTSIAFLFAVVLLGSLAFKVEQKPTENG